MTDYGWQTDDSGNMVFKTDCICQCTFRIYDTTYEAGYQRKYALALSGALGGATGTITLNIPANAVLIAALGKVKTAITGATSFNVAYNGGNSTSIESGVDVDKNTPIGAIFDANVSSPLTTDTTNILLTAVGDDFSGGEVAAMVIYEEIIEFDDFA